MAQVGAPRHAVSTGSGAPRASSGRLTAPVLPVVRETMAKRFVPLSEVAETLDISAAQAYALVRSGELPAIKVGGRGQWRVELTELDAYIERMYSQTKAFVDSQRDG